MSTPRNPFVGLTIAQPGPVLAIPDSAAEHRDAELIATCAAFDALEHAYVASFKGVIEGTPEWDDAEDEQERIQEAQRQLLTRLVELRATTLAGHAARARTLILWEGDDPTGDVNSQHANDRMLGALLRDLVTLISPLT